MTDETGLGAGRRRTSPHRDGDRAIEQVATERSAPEAKEIRARQPAPDRPEESPPLYPQRITRKYYVAQAPARSGEHRVFADARGEYLAFKDEGHRLSTRREEATIVRDFVAIAQHRDWSALRVTGSEAFRREVWLEAGARGIAVSGYEPTALDQAAQARRKADHERWRGRQTRGREAATEQGSKPVTPPARSGETARTAFLSPDIGDASKRGSGEPADAAPPVQETRATRDEPDRLHGPAGREAIADPNLAAARSQLVMLDHVVRRAFPNDRATRDAVLQVARERLSHHLREGRTIQRASYSRPVRERTPDRPMPTMRIEPERGRSAQREPHER